MRSDIGLRSEGGDLFIIRGDLIPPSKTNSSRLGHWGWFRYVQISFLLGLGLLTGFGKGKKFRCELFVLFLFGAHDRINGRRCGGTC